MDTTSLIDAACSLPNHTAILMELVFNALDSGADVLTITVDLLRNVMRCRDNGPGISKTHWPHLLDPLHDFPAAEGTLKRRNHSLARISRVAEVTLVSRTTGDPAPKIMFRGTQQYVTPLFTTGTEVVVAQAFKSIPQRYTEFSTATAKQREAAKMKMMIQTIALRFPKVEFKNDIGNTSISLKPCSSLQERWKQITGTYIRIDRTDDSLTLRCISRSLFTYGFTPFLIGNFPVVILHIDDRKVKPTDGALICMNNYQIDSTLWTDEGLDVTVSPGRENTNDDSLLAVGNEIIAKLKVVGIWDLKFIICHHNGILYAIDQHAAHERVNLDEFLRNVESFIDKKELKEPMKISVGALTELDKALKMQLRKWGWTVSPIGEYWRVDSVPVVDGRVIEDLRGMINYIEKGEDIPTCIIHALQSRACRKAIKFGDVISNEDAQQLVLKLSRCQSPNHCAHGRTVVVPIYNINKPFMKFKTIQKG